MDTLARALLVAVDLLDRGDLADARSARYARWDGPLGRRIMDGGASLADLAATVASEELDPAPVSGQQELLENRVTQAIWRR
jgi:xylose isomerase